MRNVEDVLLDYAGCLERHQRTHPLAQRTHCTCGSRYWFSHDEFILHQADSLAHEVWTKDLKELITYQQQAQQSVVKAQGAAADIAKKHTDALTNGPLVFTGKNSSFNTTPGVTVAREEQTPFWDSPLGNMIFWTGMIIFVIVFFSRILS